jgi:hypothetical protein
MPKDEIDFGKTLLNYVLKANKLVEENLLLRQQIKNENIKDLIDQLTKERHINEILIKKIKILENKQEISDK